MLPPWLIGAAIGFSIVVSLLAGLYPVEPRGAPRPGADVKYE